MPISIGAALLIGSTISAATTIGTALLGSRKHKIPPPSVPAVAASGARQDSGAQIALGVSDVKDARVSGSRVSRTKTNVVDPLGGLGRGGLAV